MLSVCAFRRCMDGDREDGRRDVVLEDLLFRLRADAQQACRRREGRRQPRRSHPRDERPAPPNGLAFVCFVLGVASDFYVVDVESVPAMALTSRSWCPPGG